ncbi:MAG: 2OG-Fe(II) oxygenase [Planctomycetota bacterium]|nr:2OG-Fe(II) oxygenase [Planctomycetota bacterium]
MATRARVKKKTKAPRTGSRDLRTELPRLLATARRPGEFHASGCVELPVVKISVDGVGTLGLPIAPAQARALIERATPAPYGKGDRTLVDPAVRRCWQLPAESVHASDPRWSVVLDTITGAALVGLGVTGKARAELYKLLVYDEGSFFLEHRDTEKSPGMFATLVVVLPSEHEGGELVVRHQDREVTLDLSGGDVGLVRFAAFYADCLHELRPVRSGYRVALVYNLVRSSGRLPSPPDHGATIERVVAALSAWPDGPEAPVKLVVPLAHHYTPAELSFAALKNEDAAAAAVMTAACARTGLLLRLAMVSIEESGAADPVWDGGYGRRRRWSRYEEEDDDGAGGEYEIIEVTERDQRVDDWRRPNDQPEPRGAIAFEDSELAPPGALDDEEPDEDHFREATGNEGGSFERTYRRAALVVWPPRNELRLLQQGGPEVAIAALKRLSRAARTRADAHALATIVVDSWPRPEASSFDPDRISARDRVDDRAALLGALTTLRDRGLLRRFLREVVVAGAFNGEENGALARALGRLDPGEAGELLDALVRRVASRRLPSLAQLLRLVAEDRPGAYLSAPLDALVAAVGRAEVRPRWDWDEEGAKRRTAAILDLAHTVAALQPSAARGEQLLRALRAGRDRWPLDEVVLPAALALAPRSAALRPIAEALRAEVADHLRARVALPLEPPADAARSTTGLSCKCDDCQDLRTFLNDRRQLTWTLRAAEARRRHVQDAARGAKADLAFRTERKGSPHSLVCTKTQASYEARVAQREADLTALAKLGAPDRPKRARR